MQNLLLTTQICFPRTCFLYSTTMPQPIHSINTGEDINWVWNPANCSLLTTMFALALVSLLANKHILLNHFQPPITLDYLDIRVV